jgi:hypothetical protein
MEKVPLLWCTTIRALAPNETASWVGKHVSLLPLFLETKNDAPDLMQVWTHPKENEELH